MKKIDLWEEIRIKQNIPEVRIQDNDILIKIEENVYRLFVTEIIEVTVHKNDHMSFDCLILRISTKNEIYEIPYEIEFNEYNEIENNFVIPKFKIIPIMPEFKKIIHWLKSNLEGMNLTWLDELEIIDKNNIVVNFKK